MRCSNLEGRHVHCCPSDAIHTSRLLETWPRCQTMHVKSCRILWWPCLAGACAAYVWQWRTFRRTKSGGEACRRYGPAREQGTDLHQAGILFTSLSQLVEMLAGQNSIFGLVVHGHSTALTMTLYLSSRYVLTRDVGVRL